MPEASGPEAANAIDRFLAAGWRETGLEPSPQADRRTLLRRLSFDLLGLPPESEEIEEFLADDRPDAWERVVDRLLASPRYGERWGRHWMDVARYADTAGDNADYPVPEARLYRDWIIDSLNADKPFDRFVEEQIAGDLLARELPPERYAEPLVATGFLALSRRYGTMPYELWHLTLEDTIDTVGRAFLGLSLRCARCHDHKDDPITSEDYYALYGIFASTRFPWAGGEEIASKKLNRLHFPPLWRPEAATPLLIAFESERTGLQAAITELEKAPERKPELEKRRGDLRRLEKPGLPANLPGAYAVGEGEAADARVQVKGDPAAPGTLVRRGAPRAFPGGGPFALAGGGSGRRELARWLSSAENPLTARVIANRLWQHHFGRGLVATPSDFGAQGERPSHPELLDWLASELVSSGWSLKRLHRLILGSSTWRLASAAAGDGRERDPANRFVARAAQRRLEAEAIRDAILAASGSLDLSRPGTHPFPPIEQWGWTQHSPFQELYPSRHRSVYLMTQRWQRHPYLALFDGADANTSTGARTSATVPQQALYLLNNPFLEEEAKRFGERIRRGADHDPGRRRFAFERAWSRPPSAEEDELARAHLERFRAAHREAFPGASDEERELAAWSSLAKNLLCASELFYVE